MPPNRINAEKTRVFVVHGRNEQLRKSMFDFLRSIGLKPIEWSQAIQMTGKTSPFIGDVLDAAFQQAQAVIVLLNGDDEAQLRQEHHSENVPDFEKKLTPQARPNVLFEAGLALGRFPNRTIIVEVGELRPFSDIAGRHTIRLNNSTQSRQDLAQRLVLAGCDTDLTGTDWHQTGNFHSPTQIPKEILSRPPAINSQALHPDSVALLNAFISFDTDSPSERNLSNSTKFTVSKVRYFLDYLIEKDLVQIYGTNYSDRQLTSYSLTKKGFEMLLSLGFA